MKIFILISLSLIQNIGFLCAQKKAVDHSTVASWPTIKSYSITNDGKFVQYSIVVPNRGVSFIIQATDGSWKKELPGIFYSSLFTADSRNIVFEIGGDSLGILGLGTDQIQYIPAAGNFLIPQEGNGQWLVYQMKDQKRTLVLLNLNSGIEKHFSDVAEYLFNKTGETLVMKSVISKDSIPQTSILWIHLTNGLTKIICQTSLASQFVFDLGGSKLVFFAREERNRESSTVLRYYQSGMDSAQIVVKAATPGMEGMLINGRSPFFGKNGSQIFFYIENSDSVVRAKPYKSTGVVIKGLENKAFGAEFIKSTPFLVVIHLDSTKNGNVIRLRQKVDNKGAFYIDNSAHWVITESNAIGEYDDYKWRESAKPDIYLISAINGTRRLIKKRLLYFDLSFSLLGKYVIWFDREQKQWFSHDIASNTTKNISGKISVPIYGEDDHPDLPYDEGLVGWLENDAAVLIYDRHDIWQVDPEGVKLPINITNGYGTRNKIRLRYLDFNEGPREPIHPDDTLLLSAFNLYNKSDGFFHLVLGSRSLEKLIMSPNSYTFQQPVFCGDHFPGPLIKAKESKLYMGARMSATEYPNLYITSDFRDFKSLTALAPQKEYNWYTTELVQWHQFDGSLAEGILYKPENFDPRKKYPIIFYYYEKNAFALNIFIHPESSSGPMNIPWFVSNGYLVFVPDIYYKIGYPGRSAYNSVVSAAVYLSKKPWVDPHRMGLQGHSYGGFETNYIVCHSSLFAAAAPAAGLTNIVGLFGGMFYGTWFFERAQGRIGATLWQRPELYIENSPVFKANKVSAAVLIMHGKSDGTVPYSQSLQWYYVLHRLEKKVWFLSYDGEDHVLSKEEDKLDYSIRLGQFFDHFLKDAPAPKWMSKGMLPGMKGKDDGLDLDTDTKRP